MLSLLPLLGRALTVADAVPDDPVLGLHYTRPEVAFELAPQAILDACAPPLYAVAWILAEADRPEGRYLLLSGPIWGGGEDGQPIPGKPVLEPFGNAGVILLTPAGACFVAWDTNAVFNNHFPEVASDFPTPFQAKLMHDLGFDLISRAERALGGRQNFLRALDATGRKDDAQDPVMIPLLKAVRATP